MADYVHFEPIDESVYPKALKIHDIIWGGFRTYLSILSDSNDPILINTIGLLTKYPEYSRYVFPLILTKLKEIETDEALCDPLWTAHELSHSLNDELVTSFTEFLTDCLKSNRMNRLRATVSTILVDIHGQDALAQAIVITKQIASDEFTSAGPSLPFGRAEVRLILERVGIDREEK